MSRVCVCIPIYNGEAYIKELLGSIEEQSFQDFEVILGDDCSTDGTISLIEPFLNDNRFRLVRYEKNAGFYANISKLIERGLKSEFFLLPGQDDYYEKDFIAHHVEMMDRLPEVGMVHSRSLLVDEQSRLVDRNYWYWERLKEVMCGRDLLEAIMSHNFVTLPAALIRSKAFCEVHKDFLHNKFTYVPDWTIWMLLAAKGWSFGYLPRADCFYRIHSSQLTQSMAPSQKEFELTLLHSEIAKLLNGKEYGDFLSTSRCREIGEVAYARQMRRALVMAIKGDQKYALPLIKSALLDHPQVLLLMPYYLVRYALAKLMQRQDANGLIELFHPLAAR